MRNGWVVLVGLIAGCVACDADVLLVDGVNGSLSPDGLKLAFQRNVGNDTHLGVLHLKNGRIEWVEKGPGRAAYPFWTPQGILLYSHGNVFSSPFKGREGSPVEGYAIRAFKDGKVRDLLRPERRLDYSPVLDPDGRTLWFCSTMKLPDKEKAIGSHSSICKADSLKPDSAEFVYTPNTDRPCGVSQIAVSPNGRHIVWGEMADIHMPWGLMASRTDDFSRRVALTPPEMAAYAPNWSPDGRLIAFTGYREGDPGWCVYLLDPALGAVRRLCRGENPSFAADGKSVIFDRDGDIRRRIVRKDDIPTPADRWAVSPARQNWFTPEKVLWRAENAEHGRVPMPEDAVFGTTKTLFIRAKVVWNGVQPSQEILCASYGEHRAGFQLYISEVGKPTMVSRNAIMLWQYVAWQKPLVPGREYELTGIRTDGALWISVDGGPAERVVLGAGQITLDHPETFMIGNGFTAGSEIRMVEVGSGWPVNVPRPRGINAFAWEDIR